MTDMTNDMTMTAADRRDAWSSGFAHGDDGHYWDSAQWIAQMLHDALSQVEAVVGRDHAAGPLRALLEPVVHEGGNHAETWEEAMDDTLSAGTVWPIGKRLDDAGLYGIYGVTPPEVPLRDRARWLDDLVVEAVAFAGRSEFAQAAGEDNAVARIARIAQSRRALDTGIGEVDVVSLSILGRISEGRLRNLMSGASPTLERGPEGGVAATSALAWLLKRRGFLRSIWDQDEDDGEGQNGDRPDAAAPVDPARTIFVPVARDNSVFHPGLKRSDAYQIGGKGEERNFDSFEAALAALNAMPVPRWRRPNDQGNWGIVSGVAWQRVERSAADAD